MEHDRNPATSDTQLVAAVRKDRAGFSSATAADHPLPPGSDDHHAIEALLAAYIDGLYRSDSARLREVLHPQALYATATEGTLLTLHMEQYWPVIDARLPPSARQPSLYERTLSIELVGPVTALAKLECAILPRHFTDLLSLVKLDGRWWIIAKVFHFDTVARTP